MKYTLPRSVRARMNVDARFALMISRSLSESAAYGNAVAFHIRDNNPKEAARMAKLAARWAYKIIGAAA